MAGKDTVVWVTGASSQLGVFLLPRLREAGFGVLALSRKAPAEPIEVARGISWVNSAVLADGGGQARTGGSGLDHLAPDHLLSCGPLGLGLRLVLRYPQLQRVVAFSSSSVLSKADSRNRGERRRMAAMAADEEALTSACAERGLPFLLLRPTLIYGCGLDGNVSLLARLAGRFGVIPLAGPAAGLRQPVHSDDLAQLAVSALRSEQPLDAVSPACGGDTLTYREMAARIAALQQRPVRLLRLPEGAMSLLVRIAAALRPGAGENPEMVRRQNRDLVFDDSALRLALDWSPRPFEPSPEDFSVPGYAQALQLPEKP
jgi:nucleoside-diphosphate-sugar epimerase